nr:helix-turn-helix domain-containing protein [Alicyclobacillus suci]
MIRLKQKQEILLAYFHEGISQREIARRTGMDRKTIRKYIVEYEQQREELIRTKDPMRIGVLTEGIVQAPKYQVGAHSELENSGVCISYGSVLRTRSSRTRNTLRTCLCLTFRQMRNRSLSC